MGPSWHTGLVYWSVSWTIQVYAVLHSRNWHSKNHWYTPIYLKFICFPKNTHRRLFTAGRWRHNYNHEEPPKFISFIVVWWCKKKSINQIAHILHRSTSQPHLQFLPLPPLLPQTWNENFSTSEYLQNTSNSSEGGTVFATSEGATNSAGTHTTFKTTYFHIT